MKYLHTMVRVLDLEKSLHFYRDLLGLKVTRKTDVEAGRFTLVYLATEDGEPEVELTHNWDQQEPYTYGRNFGHLAYAVDNIYEMYVRNYMRTESQFCDHPVTVVWHLYGVLIISA